VQKLQKYKIITSTQAVRTHTAKLRAALLEQRGHSRHHSESLTTTHWTAYPALMLLMVVVKRHRSTLTAVRSHSRPGRPAGRSHSRTVIVLCCMWM